MSDLQRELERRPKFALIQHAPADLKLAAAEGRYGKVEFTDSFYLEVDGSFFNVVRPIGEIEEESSDDGRVFLCVSPLFAAGVDLLDTGDEEDVEQPADVPYYRIVLGEDRIFGRTLIGADRVMQARGEHHLVENAVDEDDGA